MRDIVLILIVLGSVPFILMRPYVGAYMWAWLGFMNPHRFTYGFAYNFPFATIVAVATLLGLLFFREQKRFPWTPLTSIWVLFVLWMCFTTLFALVPESAYPEWTRMIKIQVMTIITIILIQNRERLHVLVWVVAGSLAFFGIKGGIFSIASGGRYMVWGPEGSFISGNNSIALALVMTLPLLRYLQLNSDNRWVKWGLMGAMGLCALSTLSSYSRGAFLAISVMAIFLIMKSRRKGMILLGFILVVPIMLQFMPEKWFDRMGTIQTYEEDGSALGRINAWWFAYNLAKDHPVVGGGFNAFDPTLFYKYAPEPENFHDSHSIYFEVLGEHGFVGLALFLSLGLLAILGGSQIIKMTKNRDDLKWAMDLAAMIQVSLIGYAVGGVFLGLAYFDLYYTLIAMLVITRLVVERELSSKTDTGQEVPACSSKGGPLSGAG